MATIYKVKNNSRGCVVTEFWDSEPVRKHFYSVLYAGGNIIEFMENNYRYKLSEKTNFSALNRWLCLK